jgi:hypothetical protein
LPCDSWWRALFEVHGRGLLIANSAEEQAAQPTSSGVVWSTCGTAFGITADFNNRTDLASNSSIVKQKKLLGSLSKFRRQLKANGFLEGHCLSGAASSQSNPKKRRLSVSGVEEVTEVQCEVKMGFSFSSPGLPCPDVEFPAGLTVLYAYVMEGITSSASWSSYAHLSSPLLRKTN